jgi:hypothetical protein
MHNTDGWGNKLVTIFADHTRTIIMTRKPANSQVNLLVAGGQDSDKSGLITYTWICKNCAMVACRRDNFLAKEPGLESADSATNVYSLNRRTVSGNCAKTS